MNPTYNVYPNARLKGRCLIFAAISLIMSPIQPANAESGPSEIERIPTVSVGYSYAMGWYAAVGTWFRAKDSVERLEPGGAIGLTVGQRAVKLDGGPMFYPSYAGVTGSMALLIPYDERPVSVGIEVEVGVKGAYVGVGAYGSLADIIFFEIRDNIREKLHADGPFDEEDDQPRFVFDARVGAGYFH